MTVAYCRRHSKPRLQDGSLTHPVTARASVDCRHRPWRALPVVAADLELAMSTRPKAKLPPRVYEREVFVRSVLMIGLGLGSVRRGLLVHRRPFGVLGEDLLLFV